MPRDPRSFSRGTFRLPQAQRDCLLAAAGILLAFLEHVGTILQETATTDAETGKVAGEHARRHRLRLRVQAAGAETLYALAPCGDLVDRMCEELAPLRVPLGRAFALAKQAAHDAPRLIRNGPDKIESQHFALSAFIRRFDS